MSQYLYNLRGERTAELEKRITELEADRTNLIELMRLKNDFFCKLVTAERKRREECEAVLREVAGAPNRIAENSRIIADYFGEGNGKDDRNDPRDV